MDPFKALGLARDASGEEIRQQYRRLLRRYHPNGQQSADDSKDGLTHRYLEVQQAWNLVKHAGSRRRYREFLALLDEQHSIFSNVNNVLATEDELDCRLDSDFDQSHNASESSDADEDIAPHLAILNRRTMKEKYHGSPASLPTEEQTGSREYSYNSAQHGESLTCELASSLKGSSDGRTASAWKEDDLSRRRRQLAKLRHKEKEAFWRHREAYLRKLEAELETERTRDIFDAAKWNRKHFERAPRDTAELVRSFQHLMDALRAFQPRTPPMQRRPSWYNVRQILSTEDSAFPEALLQVDAHANKRHMHQRAYSSDVSGDQTSSEDGTESSRTTPPLSSSHWQAYSRRFAYSSQSELAYGRLQHFTDARSDHKSRYKHAARHPFKVIVKRPTGITEDAQHQASSTPSRSSSCSPPPQTPSDVGSHRFVFKRSMPLDELFRDECGSSTSTSALRPETYLKKGLPKGRRNRAAFEAQELSIKRTGEPSFRRIPNRDVYTLSFSEKIKVLNTFANQEAAPLDLLKRLAFLDANLARRFMVKPDIKADFNFRLIRDTDSYQKPYEGSFIALSYRRRLHVRHDDEGYSLPLEPDLFQAIWDERLTREEGLWVDQICIDQDSEVERTVSMSAMDMVYRSARIAIVVLDDLDLNPSEVDVLHTHMREYTRLSHVTPNKRFRHKQPAYLSAHEDLCSVVQKLLQSSWFRRAWCRHEMRLAREHLFLIPFSERQGASCRSIIRFTGRCLTHLLALATEVPLHPNVELIKPALNAFFRDRYRHHEDRSSDHQAMTVHRGNFTTVIAEVFAMEAGGDPRISELQRRADALKDKTSIVLNTMDCGLALSTDIRAAQVSVSRSECQYMLLILALAARDPAALCSVGPPMLFSLPEALSPTASTTWLFEPTNVDSGLNNYRTLSQTPLHAEVTTHVSHGEHFVTLGLHMLGPSRHGFASDTMETYSLAKRIMREARSRNAGRNRARYLISDLNAMKHFGSMYEMYAETLACVLECGPDWVDQVCHRYRMSRTKQDLKGAYELLIALKNTSGLWPEYAWHEAALSFIMDFVNFVLIRALPQRQIIQYEAWKPIWIVMGNGGKSITFIPIANVSMAVPEALLDPEYVRLARLWMLLPRNQESNQGQHFEKDKRWTLLGKSVLFSDDLATESLHHVSSVCVQQQHVYGREDQRWKQNLRENEL